MKNNMIFIEENKRLHAMIKSLIREKSRKLSYRYNYHQPDITFPIHTTDMGVLYYTMKTKELY